MQKRERINNPADEWSRGLLEHAEISKHGTCHTLRKGAPESAPRIEEPATWAPEAWASCVAQTRLSPLGEPLRLSLALTGLLWDEQALGRCQAYGSSSPYTEHCCGTVTNIVFFSCPPIDSRLSLYPPSPGPRLRMVGVEP